jgi:hypothetical protein
MGPSGRGCGVGLGGRNPEELEHMDGHHNEAVASSE